MYGGAPSTYSMGLDLVLIMDYLILYDWLAKFYLMVCVKKARARQWLNNDHQIIMYDIREIPFSKTPLVEICPQQPAMLFIFLFWTSIKG